MVYLIERKATRMIAINYADMNHQYGFGLLRHILDCLIRYQKDLQNIYSCVGISLEKIDCIEKALVALIVDNKELRQAALEFLVKENEAQKVLWGPIAPYIAILHFFLFIKKDYVAFRELYKLVQTTVRMRQYISSIDEVLVKLIEKTWEFKIQLEKIRKNLCLKKIDKKTAQLAIKSIIESTIDTLRKISTIHENILVRLAREVFIAELGWNNAEYLDSLINEFIDFEESVVTEPEIINGFLIMRDELTNIVLKYFNKRARVLCKAYKDNASKCRYMENEKKRLEKELKKKREIWSKRFKKIFTVLVILSFLDSIPTLIEKTMKVSLCLKLPITQYPIFALFYLVFHTVSYIFAIFLLFFVPIHCTLKKLGVRDLYADLEHICVETILLRLKRKLSKLETRLLDECLIFSIEEYLEKMTHL